MCSAVRVSDACSSCVSSYMQATDLVTNVVCVDVLCIVSPLIGSHPELLPARISYLVAFANHSSPCCCCCICTTRGSVSSEPEVVVLDAACQLALGTAG